MLPLKILNRLLLGREVAAEIKATLPEHRAWVLIWPQIDTEHGYFNKLNDYGEPIAFSNDGQPALKGFAIIYVEIEQQMLEEALSNASEIPYSAATLERSDFARDETELEAKLSEHLTDLSCLQLPSKANFPFT